MGGSHKSAQLSLIDKSPVKSLLIPLVLSPTLLLSLSFFFSFQNTSLLLPCVIYVSFLSMLPNCELVEVSVSRLHYTDWYSKKVPKVNKFTDTYVIKPY